ncbi:Uma2 family endonuclease [Nostoc sp. TCL26-01]|uniref:Uma2 family endonuclease n=1 Tax=Nostoc sp. TCL26-01 TaxID=2576904 RepID=UPI0015B9DCCC|nr:Uma2 family endonuclease [Nostoc sp. TCL26-01]QLE56707.1 Uma2 family endonuclease [Nostoc sp. TCL26-01]
MLLELNRIYVPPGQTVLLRDVTWQELETILEELGEHRAARIAYDKGILEIMAPLPEHEDDKEIIGDLVKAFLEELDIEFRCLGSTTFKNQAMAQGIEPDQCFYIKNESKIRGKNRLDLTVDPPPDLALEIDITSRTHPHIYQALKVPELWQFARGKLKINILQDGVYVESPESLNFPGLTLIDIIPQYLEQSKIIGRNATLRAFRLWVRQQIQQL